MSVKIPTQHCPYCKYEVDRTDGLESYKPKPGDISLCLKCMEVSLFDDGMILRAPNDKEMVEIQRSLGWDLIERARRAHRELNLRNTIHLQGR